MLVGKPSVAWASVSVLPLAVAIAVRVAGVRSVTVMPGCTTVTLMPSRPSSSARFLVMAATRDVADGAERAAGLPGRPGRADVDDPPPALGGHVRRGGQGAAQVAEHLGLDLAPQVIVVEISQPGRPRVGVAGSAAAFTRMSMPPSSLATRAVIARTAASSLVSAATAIALGGQPR